MPIRLWKPLRVLDIERCIDEAFSELIHEPWGRPLAAEFWQPAVDVYETEDAYLIEADLPGVAPDAIQVSVEDRRVVLRGSRRTVQWQSAGRTVRVERAQGEFLRTLELDQPVDVTRIDRQFEHGLLRVRLPKLRKQSKTD